MKEGNISHYLFSYDLLEFDFKRVYQSFNVSYFTKDDKLLSKFYNLDELRDYESVEDDKKSIIIKKFKLRVSIDEKSYFSNDIIISNDYLFDFMNVSHSDSLIKIALVHDNVDKWIESGNLKDYDFIFTVNKEYVSLLKEKNKQVYIVNGKSIYLQLKNILNLLYMRKKEKFYYFINNRFNYVFPKKRNYFKILHSEFYDEEWYKREYDISDNIDPVLHYLIIGYLKGFNPSPDFDSWNYYNLNSDVKSADFNPLLHYEMYGRKENRKYQFTKEEKNVEYFTISNSSYYDKEWYVENYDIPNDIDPVNHYLNEGYKKGFNPGPNFSTNEYYECNRDVKNRDMNPLLHYELYGQFENRKIRLSD